MFNILVIEHAKNMRARRRMAVISYILAIAMTLCRCVIYKSAPSSLLEFIDMIIPYFFIQAVCLSNYTGDKWLDKLAKGIGRKPPRQLH